MKKKISKGEKQYNRYVFRGSVWNGIKKFFGVCAIGIVMIFSGLFYFISQLLSGGKK